jgi:hypothetical protein
MRLKLIILATIALVLNLITISPVKADVGINKINSKLTISNTACAQRLCQSFKIVEEMAPIFMNVGNVTSRILFRQDLGDRLFNLNEKAGVACLVDAQGSVDGSVTCGTIDKF